MLLNRVIQSYLKAKLDDHWLCVCFISPVVKGKNAKGAGVVTPLQEGVELNDQSGGKWKLLQLLMQSENEVIYKGKTLCQSYGCVQFHVYLLCAYGLGLHLTNWMTSVDHKWHHTECMKSHL